MNITPAFPSFDIHLADLNQFILELVDAHEAGNIKSWIDLEETVDGYFTPDRMDYIEARAPARFSLGSRRGESFTKIGIPRFTRI